MIVPELKDFQHVNFKRFIYFDLNEILSLIPLEIKLLAVDLDQCFSTRGTRTHVREIVSGDTRENRSNREH